MIYICNLVFWLEQHYSNAIFDHLTLPYFLYRLTWTSDSETERPPLFIKFTGYRLLTIVVTLAFWVPKAIQKVKGENCQI